MHVLCDFCREFSLGNGVDDMQVGCLWQDDFILTFSLSGFINYLDKSNPAKPLRVVKVSGQFADEDTVYCGVVLSCFA